MNKLAIKSTRKNRKYNNKHLAKKLNVLAEKVAKRDIFVVKRADIGYNIFNYVNKKTFVEAIPFKSVADRYCNFLNTTKETQSPMHIKKHIDIYYKHYMDLQFYKHTIKHSDDVVKVFTAGVRMQDSLDFVREAKKRLFNF